MYYVVFTKVSNYIKEKKTRMANSIFSLLSSASNTQHLYQLKHLKTLTIELSL